MKLQKSQLKDSKWKTKVEIPEWFPSFIKTRPSREEIFKETLTQLTKNPSGRQFLFVRLLLNESLKLNGGSEYLAEKFKPELISNFMGRGEK